MTDQNASTGQEKPKYYIAESYARFRDYCRQNNITVSDRYFISTDGRDRLYGLELLPDQIEICYDPKAAWSFWLELMAMTQRAATRQVL